MGLRGGAAGPSAIKAILFDVFGTTVDWLSSMTAFGKQLGTERGIDADWEGLMRERRKHYKPAIKAVRDGKRPWADFDTLHREELEKVVVKFGAKKLTSADRDLLTQGWHHLRTWPEVPAALHQLAKSHILGPLSNGTTRQLIDIARLSGLPWSVIFGADMFKTYKPAPELYVGTCKLLGLDPKRVLLVAAHNEDLQHAAAQGLHTCFVQRSTEDAKAEGKYDFVVEDFDHLARTLGAV